MVGLCKCQHLLVNCLFAPPSVPALPVLCSVFEGATFPGLSDPIARRGLQPWQFWWNTGKQDLGKGQGVSSPFFCIMWQLLHGSSSDPAVISALVGQPPAVLPNLTASHSHFMGTCLVSQPHCLLYLLPVSYIKFLLIRRPRMAYVSWLEELATNINSI